MGCASANLARHSKKEAQRWAFRGMWGGAAEDIPKLPSEEDEALRRTGG
jgi:hypothetical protein